MGGWGGGRGGDREQKIGHFFWTSQIDDLSSQKHNEKLSLQRKFDVK